MDLGPSGTLVRATLVDAIGNALCATSDFRRARPLIEEALRIRRDALPADDPDIALSLFHLAMLDHFSGRHESAHESYLAAAEILAKAPARHAALLDIVEFHHAWALAEMQRLAEAGAMIDRVLERRKRVLGVDHADTRNAQFASYLIKLGSGDRNVLLARGRQADAFERPPRPTCPPLSPCGRPTQAGRPDRGPGRRRTREATARGPPVRRPGGPPVAPFRPVLLLGDMAEFERKHDNFPRAVALIREAFEIGRQVAPTHPLFIKSLAVYAEEMARRQQFGEAEHALIEALDAIVDRDERERRGPQFKEYLERLLGLPKYRDNPGLARLLKKKYE